MLQLSMVEPGVFKAQLRSENSESTWFGLIDLKDVLDFKTAVFQVELISQNHIVVVDWLSANGSEVVINDWFYKNFHSIMSSMISGWVQVGSKSRVFYPQKYARSLSEICHVPNDGLIYICFDDALPRYVRVKQKDTFELRATNNTRLQDFDGNTYTLDSGTLETDRIYECVFLDAGKSIVRALKIDFNRVHRMVLLKTTYAAHIQIYSRFKIHRVKFSWLIMFGSLLDIFFRKLKVSTVSEYHLKPCHFLTKNWEAFVSSNFTEPIDILSTLYFISGTAKQIPLYIFNNCLKLHTTGNSKRALTLRQYSYSTSEDGFKIEYRDGIIRLTDKHGRTSNNEDALKIILDSNTWLKSDSSLALKEYYDRKASEVFDIDHLKNKLILESGEVLYRIAKSELLPLLKDMIFQDQNITNRLASLDKRLLSGQAFTDSFSKKTVFECSAAKRDFRGVPKQFGENGEVYLDKENSVFQAVNVSAYPLIPFLSSMARRVLSEKTRSNRALAFNISHVGYLCPLMTSESKNIGRTVALCRDLQTSFHTQKKIQVVLDTIQQRYVLAGPCSDFIIIINHLPLKTSEQGMRSFLGDLYELKLTYGCVECYLENTKLGHFTIMNGLPFKNIGNSTEHFYASPPEFEFWTVRIYPGISTLEDLVNFKGFDFVSSSFTALAPLSQHNSSSKVTLLLNNWRNAIIATDKHLGETLLEPIFSVKYVDSNVDNAFFETKDIFSDQYQVFVPRLVTAVATAGGWNQEDCLVVNRDCQFALTESVTRRVCPKVRCILQFPWKANFPDQPPQFEFKALSYGSEGPGCCPVLLGNVIEIHGYPFAAASYCPGISFQQKSRFSWLVFYSKNRFIVETATSIYPASNNQMNFIFALMLVKEQRLADGDKLCSLNGQKGVVKLLPPSYVVKLSSGRVVDLMLHPLSVLKRQTVGELLMFGGAREEEAVLPNGSTQRLLVADTSFLQVNFRSEDSLYISAKCAIDAVLNQPTKGSNRNGAMKIGPMELRNCFAANGLASTTYELLIENSDLKYAGTSKSTTAFELCNADAKFFKCEYEISTEAMVEIT
ncbi:putative DNA-directed RNA polymerase [Halotydeus destructor]|nr:putative DNA-directed RNA polymerase [Halotydeus destructor]